MREMSKSIVELFVEEELPKIMREYTKIDKNFLYLQYNMFHRLHNNDKKCLQYKDFKSEFNILETCKYHITRMMIDGDRDDFCVLK